MSWFKSKPVIPFVYPFKIGDKIRRRTWPKGVYFIVGGTSEGDFDNMRYGWFYQDQHGILKSSWLDAERFSEYYDIVN